ncbi:LPS export ABC transporter permease LptG [Candidatus Deferrimicrobium sp.]|uniref:LPS export ABC transporter permease LptG n=1 Tax=Candidatus Deferrimicrobium sp. TaxID=3060586 RepID=UPI002EDACF4B
MTVLSRYLFREFLRAAAVCILGFLLLFLLIDFVDHAEKLLQHNAGLREIGWYYLTRVPGIFVLISPVGTMLAVLLAVSLRVRSNELTAIFSGGVSLLRACVPILVGCALVSALSLLCSEVLAPAANRNAREVERLRVRPGRVAAQFSANRYWMRGERGILSAQVVDGPSRTLRGFQYIEVDSDFRPLRRIESRGARLLPDGAWELAEGRERIFGETPSVAAFPLRTYRFPETMDGFIAGETPPEEMTYAQLSGYVGELRRKGYEAWGYETDLHAKIAYPLLNILISMLAIPFALRSPRSGGVWRSIGLGLLVGFACWVVLSTSLSLGRKGVLPALLAAWLPGVLFAGSGAALFRGVGR